MAIQRDPAPKRPEHEGAIRVHVKALTEPPPPKPEKEAEAG